MRLLRDSGESPVRRRLLQRMAVCLLGCGLLPLAPAHAQSAGKQVFELRIANGRLESDQHRTLRVTQGDVVELRWNTDEPVEIHLHGYDRRLRVTSDAPATLSFEARATGRFPITRHAADGHGHETLLYLEVYPR